MAIVWCRKLGRGLGKYNKGMYYNAVISGRLGEGGGG